MAIDRHSASLIGNRIRKRKILDTRDAVARRLRIRGGFPA